MAMQVFAAEELARLREFPDISREELFRHFTLTPADIAFLTPGRGRGPAERLGLSVTLCALPWLGFVPDKVASAPAVAVARLAQQLDVDVSLIDSYGKRAQTREMYDERDRHGKRKYTVAQIAETFGVSRKTIYRHLEPA